MDDRGRGAAPRFQHSELALALRAVRALEVGPTSRGRTPAVLLFSAILLGLLHTAVVTRFPSYPVGATASAAFGAGNEDVSMQFKKVAAVVSSALAVSAGAHAQDAVQWRVEDGGNGHWYAVYERPYGTYNWNETRALVQSVGADLATFQTMSEWLFFRAITQQYEFTQYLSGGTRAAGPQSQWMWLDGTPFSYTAWASGVPNNGTGIDLVLTVGKGLTGPSGTDGWDDWRVVDFSNGYTLEWSADCNADGIVDYGQIRAGELVDANANNIPDCCEQSVSCSPCPGDIDESGTVNGVDLAAILAVWGSDGGKYPRADTNNDGVVNGADLATVLGSWGSCE